MTVQQHRTLLEPLAVIFAGLGWLLGCSSTPQSAPASSPRAEPRAVHTSATDTTDALGPAPVRHRAAQREVTFSLQAHVTSLQPGSTLWFAARFAIPPGAHIYWINPGESGLATTVQFTAPSALSLAAPRYPGPRRFASVGGSVGYGYADELVVLAPATVGGEVRDAVVSAEASWLSCDVVCVKQSGRSSVRLGAEHALSQSELTAWQALLPSPASDEIGELGWIGPDTFRVTTRPGSTPREFFPLARLGPDDRDCLHTNNPDARTLDVQLRSVHQARPVAGVLLLEGASGARYVELSVP